MNNIIDSFHLSRQHKIYNYLQDDLSRQIFQIRAEYSATGDDLLIPEMAVLNSGNTPEDLAVKSWIRNALIWENNSRQAVREFAKMHKGKIAVCGVGGVYGKRLANILSDTGDRVILCDQNGDNRNILQTKEAVRKNADAVFAVASIRYFQEIRNELVAYGVRGDRIVLFDVRSAYELISDSCRFPVFGGLLTYVGWDSYYDHSFLHPGEENVLVDCGFLDGESTENFIRWCGGKYSKVIAFEPDPISYANAQKKFNCNEKIEIINKGVWSDKATLKFKKEEGGSSHIDSTDGDVVIETDTIDHVVGGANVTFIKMDIEGSELEALRGASETIRRCKPILAVCVYHKPEDIIEIPDYILRLNPSYKLYLRIGSYDQCETVLYAVP